MSVVSIRLNSEERTIFENASKLYGCKLSSLIRDLALEKLEDDFDLQIFQEYEQEKNDNKLKTRPIEHLWKELEL